MTAIFTALAIAGCTGCSQQPPVYTKIEGMNWNTFYHITYDSDADLSEAVLNAMKEVEMSLSPFNEGSLISALNRSESDSIDCMIEEVFAESQHVNRLSGGMFDPTVAPLINLWGFGYDKAEVLPSDVQIDSCLELVGIMECAICDGRLLKKSPCTQFNFSAITKGYGCDKVAEALSREGCNNFIVEIGGEIRLRGVNPQGEKWHIQVDAPVEGVAVSERLAVIELTNCGIATSGNYRNFRDTDEGRIGHTISPITGRPVQSELLSATVIAPTTMTADALATACMAMPLDAALSMIEDLGEGYSAMFVIPATDSHSDSISSTSPWKTVTTSRFPRLQ